MKKINHTHKFIATGEIAVCNCGETTTKDKADINIPLEELNPDLRANCVNNFNKEK